MNPQKNQGAEDSPLLRDLQAEVSSESAPMLQFMLRHAGTITTRASVQRKTDAAPARSSQRACRLQRIQRRAGYFQGNHAMLLADGIIRTA